MLALHDFVNNELFSLSIPPQTVTASVVGTTGDFGNGQGYCVAEVNHGPIEDGVYQFCVRESSNKVTGFATITDTTMAAISETSAATVTKLMFARTKRYLRLVCTASGSPSTGGVLAGVIRSVRSISGGGAIGTNTTGT